MSTPTNSLDAQFAEFRSRRFIATPIAGTIAWLAIGVAGLAFETEFARSMSIFIGTGMIFYVALVVAKFTGEDLLGKTRPSNLFDKFFLLTVFQAVMAYSISIPFFLIERSSLPLTVGILTGLMWIPFSGLAGHWVGVFHTSVRTASILFLWYAFPEQRFITIPFAIVAVYVVTIALLELRFRGLESPATN